MAKLCTKQQMTLPLQPTKIARREFAVTGFSKPPTSSSLVKKSQHPLQRAVDKMWRNAANPRANPKLAAQMQPRQRRLSSDSEEMLYEASRFGDMVRESRG